MNVTATDLPRDAVQFIRGEWLLRRLHQVLPLGRKYHPVLSLLNGRRGLLAIPFDGHQLVQPAVWAKQIAQQLLAGVDVVPEFRLLAPLCRQFQAGCLLDVGANIGLYTLLLRSVSRLPIIAYEPQPFLFKLLQWNIAHNRLSNVETRNVACGAERGEIPFSVGINGAVLARTTNKWTEKAPSSGTNVLDWEAEAQQTREGGTVINVPVTALDEDLSAAVRIALLKIDCEGFELNILQGARRLIEQHKPALFLEVHPTLLGRFGHSVKEVLELVRPNYDLEFWCFDQIRQQSKLGRSIAKFRRPDGRRYDTEEEMLAAAGGDPRPAQIYFIGRPKTNFK